MYEMKPEYYTHIALIDEEHKQLFNYINEIEALLEEQYLVDKYDQIADALEKLRAYTKKHFADEEQYMESIRYKRLFTQKMQHQAFIEKLDDWDLYSLNQNENYDETIQQILDFLSNWLIHHILELDTKIGK